jgi:uncharacterized heparinase superfamily protein
MGLARTFRTIRHLGLSQLLHRPICRGRFAAMERLPGAAHRHFRRRAASIGRFDFTRPDLVAAVEHVVGLQRAVHGSFLDGIPEGRFTLLDRTIDFGGLDAVEWRRDLGERNNRLWRMTLSYLGHLVALVERDGAAALPVVRSLLASMTAQNPWSAPGVFRDVWHPYSVSHRVIDLIACLTLLERSGTPVEATARAEIEAEIRLGAAFLLGNLERDLQYNHLFKNFVCLALVAAALVDRRGFAARELAGVTGSIAQQFLSDGGHAERSPMYHLLAVIDLRILRDSGVLAAPAAEAVRATLERAERSIAVVTHPDGEIALFNDGWLGEAPAAVDLVATALPRPERPLRIERPAFGYARLARGGDGVVFDYGACGPDANPGHAHADFLSLELSIDGVRTLVDPGVPTYSEGEARDRSRSAASHDGPCLIGAEPIEFWSSFRVGRRGRAHRLALPDRFEMTVAGRHDGYAPLGLRVARAVRLRPGHGLLVVDLWEGPLALPETTRFLVAAPWQWDGGGRFSRTTDAGVGAFSVTVLRGRADEAAAADHCLRFGERRAATRIAFSPEADGGRRVLMLWFEWGLGRRPPIDDGPALVAALGAALAEAG